MTKDEKISATKDSLVTKKLKDIFLVGRNLDSASYSTIAVHNI